MSVSNNHQQSVQKRRRPNFTSASGSVSIDVEKAPAAITLSNLVHVYDGVGKEATATTSPLNLTGLSLTYDGASALPVNAGSYSVDASLTNANYTAADAKGTLSIAKASPTITWPQPAGITYGAVLSGAQLNATASVPGTFVYNPGSGALLNAGLDRVLEVAFTPFGRR